MVERKYGTANPKDAKGLNPKRAEIAGKTHLITMPEKRHDPIRIMQKPGGKWHLEKRRKEENPNKDDEMFFLEKQVDLIGLQKGGKNDRKRVTG